MPNGLQFCKEKGGRGGVGERGEGGGGRGRVRVERGKTEGNGENVH